ncbi:MAG: DUF2062 domain-containing protein [Candidatus Omnitrophota bacterium]|jgi:hypothetical protein
MNKKAILSRVSRFFKLIYLKLFRINDSPQRIAIGLGVGVFLGIIPAMGPMASLFFAVILRVNRASAILGSLLTNTWLSVVTFAVSVRLGSFLTGTNSADVITAWRTVIKDFKLSKLAELAVYDLAAPVVLGYIIVAAVIGLAAYLAALFILKYAKGRKYGSS